MGKKTPFLLNKIFLAAWKVSLVILAEVLARPYSKTLESGLLA